MKLHMHVYSVSIFMNIVIQRRTFMHCYFVAVLLSVLMMVQQAGEDEVSRRN